jgi:type IVB pilus formation R64 PilN family outer membrane protein
MTKFYARTALGLAVALTINGCAVYGDKRDVDQQSASTMDSTQQRIGHDLRKVTLDQKYASQEVDLPFLASQPRPISRDAELPLVLQGKIPITSVFSNDGEASLPTLARRIQDASGILVEVTPDALMPLSEFGPRLTESKNAQKGGGLADLSPQTASANTMDLNAPIVPGDAGAVAVSTPAQQSPQPAARSATRTPQLKQGEQKLKQGEQKLSAVLDQVTVPLGLYWRPENNGHKIVIYRTETRMFEIRGAETNPVGKTDLSLTGSIGQSEGNNSVDSKSVNTVELPKMEAAQIEDIKKRALQFMTKSGKVADAAGNMLIVTDTKDALDQIQEFVDAENKSRNRIIEFTLEEITVENTQSDQAGLTYNVLFNPSGNGSQFNLNGLNSLLEQQGAAASLGLGVASGPWQGSSIALQALSKVGKVVGNNTDSSGTVNGTAVTMGEPQHRKYPDKLQQTQSTSDNSKPTVSVSQATESWGRMVTILPSAYGNGDARLVFKFDNTPMPQFDKSTFPDGSYVVSPWAKGDVLARQALVRSGQPYVIRATVRDSNGYTANRVDRNAPVALGGSDVADKTQRITLLVLTAMVKER